MKKIIDSQRHSGCSSRSERRSLRYVRLLRYFEHFLVLNLRSWIFDGRRAWSQACFYIGRVRMVFQQGLYARGMLSGTAERNWSIFSLIKGSGKIVHSHSVSEVTHHLTGSLVPFFLFSEKAYTHIRHIASKARQNSITMKSRAPLGSFLKFSILTEARIYSELTLDQSPKISGQPQKG